MKAKTIITYLVDGNPAGIKTVEFSNKLIKGISIPRKDFKESLKRKELDFSGIYFLMGEDEYGNDLAYIGQATILKNRLNSHYNDIKKDFWNTVICFTYKDVSLNESDINYLEKEIIAEAKKIDRYHITNNTIGNNGLIQEHRIPDMEEFISDLKILLVNLGYSLLKEIVSKKEIENEENIYYIKSRGSNAKGIYSEEGFLVLKGSKGPKIQQESIIKHKLYSFRNRPKLLEKGIIIENGENIEFIKDHLFTSPSSASDIITGASTNGWTYWKDKNGKTLDENERK